MHFQDWRKNILGSKNTTLIQFLNDIEEYVLKTSPETFWRRADSKLAAVIIEPNLVLKSLITNIEVVIDGKARGSLLVDYKKDYTRNLEMANVKIVQNMDENLYRNMLLDLLQ